MLLVCVLGLDEAYAARDQITWKRKKKGKTCKLAGAYTLVDKNGVFFNVPTGALS